MKKFSVIKTNKKIELKDKLELKRGYKFNRKIKVTLYNNTLIKYILIKKIEKSFQKIIDMIILLSDDCSDDEVDVIVIKIETLRNILLGKYAPYIGVKKTNKYIERLDMLVGEASSRQTIKSRTI